MMSKILIHYHEIALKKGNRRFFVDRLRENIHAAFKGSGEVNIEKLPGRLLLRLERQRGAVSILEKIPGIANFLPVWESDDLEALKAQLPSKLQGKRFKTFKVSTQRGDKGFPLTSEGVNRDIGAFVQEESGGAVDLDKPEFVIFIEIASGRIFWGFEKIQGIGGLPVGSSGKAIVLLSGGIDSPVASFMMMRRGCRLTFVHFHAFPYLDRSSQEKAKELVALLNQHQSGSKLYFVSFGDIQKEIVLKSPEAYRVIIYRRLMMRISEKVALKEGAGALVTGESLGQVASQTMENISVINEAVNLPIFRPLIGMNKQEVVDRAKDIGTYDISIRPDQDCCQLFTPQHPATRSDIRAVEKIEAEIGVSRLISQADLTEVGFG
jgi:thiamine biosynthesis protein ThiI